MAPPPAPVTLPTKVTLVRVEAVVLSYSRPPPSPLAVLPSMVVRKTVRTPPKMSMPPPVLPARLLVISLSLIDSPVEVWMAPPLPVTALLPKMRLSLTVMSLVTSVATMPPPLKAAELLLMVLLATMTVVVPKRPVSTSMPPPKPVATLPVMVLLLTMMAPSWPAESAAMPPPSPPPRASLSLTVQPLSVTEPGPDREMAPPSALVELWATMTLFSSRVLPLPNRPAPTRMAPPLPPSPLPCSMVMLGSARLPITTSMLSKSPSGAMSKTRLLPPPPSMTTAAPLVFSMFTLLLMMTNSPALLSVAPPGMVIW